MGDKDNVTFRPQDTMSPLSPLRPEVELNGQVGHSKSKIQVFPLPCNAVYAPAWF